MYYILKLSTLRAFLQSAFIMHYSFFLIYSSVYSLMMATYSGNMYLVCTPIKLCLVCDCTFFFLICVQYLAYLKQFWLPDFVSTITLWSYTGFWDLLVLQCVWGIRRERSISYNNVIFVALLQCAAAVMSHVRTAQPVWNKSQLAAGEWSVLFYFPAV
jgi:hypothetical protein